MPTLTSLTVNLKGDSSSLVKAASSGARAIRIFGQGVSKSLFSLKGLVASIGAAAGIGGIGAIAGAASQSVDEIGKLSTQLKIAASDVQKLGIVSSLSGVSTEDLVKGVQRITRILGDAKAGSKSARATFNDLGLQWDKLAKVSPINRFKLVAGALARMSDQTTKASFGNKLFEEQWQRFGPLMDGFADGMARADYLVTRLGLGLTDKGARGVENLNDNITIVTKSMQMFRDMIFAKVAPVLNDIVVDFGKMLEGFIKAEGGASKLANTLINRVAGAVETVMGVMKSLHTAMTPILVVFDAFHRFLKGLGHLQGGAVAAVGAALTGNFSGAASIIGALPAGVAGAAGFDVTQSEEEMRLLKESEEQTQLLRDIVKNGATGALVF